MSFAAVATPIQRLLVVNCGSSTFKWSVLDVASEATLANGSSALGEVTAESLPELLAGAEGFDAVAHRIVHGGARFAAVVRVDDPVREALEELLGLAPLHMRPALGALDACSSAFPKIPQFAAFDTAFHRTIPEHRRQYALPKTWRERWQLQRFGFHGLSVEYCVHRTREILGALPPRLLVCHLGSGCSITAVEKGCSVDTTMGFTPLEGPMMATRSGSIDPGLLLWLLRSGLSLEEVERGLWNASGLIGLSEGKSDLRALLAAQDAGSATAKLAYTAFQASVVHSIGAMLAALGGVDALVMTGGMGENSSRLRADLLRPFAFAGVVVDEAANARAAGDATLSPGGAAVTVLALHTREDLSILHGVKAALRLATPPNLEA